MLPPLYEDLEAARRTVLARRLWDESEVPEAVLRGIEARFGEPLTPGQAVDRILAEVRREGDWALRRWSQVLDGVDPDPLEVPQEALDEALETIRPEVRQALERAAGRIRAFHARQPTGSWFHAEDGVILGQKWVPLERVGIYVPGGRALYPSSLLMTAIPARVAGVREVLVVSPPGPDGELDPVLLAAARIAGADRVFRVGGAQAVAALAFGTETIPRVDKIVGPGGLFVVLALRRVFGYVGVGGLPGPTETLLIADGTARPAWVAADLLAQAEHDPLATALLLTPSAELARAVQEEVERQLAGLARREIAAAALRDRGGIVRVPDLETAFELANEFAPEHLCLLLADPWRWLDRVRNAGGVFLGEHAGEALGDYVLGPSHVMPTGGTARFAGPLHVGEFLRPVSVFYADPRAAAALAPTAEVLARVEGLTAHEAAARLRRTETSEEG